MALDEYRKKRDFSKTNEPSGSAAPKPHKGLLFCIQKHAASHLHYDFRLEWNGVLLSWAVPKGPNLDPKVKRLAMRTEDHPIEYGEFEGTIPKGEYGGGTVMLWDKGTWEPVEDAARGLEKGHLKFKIKGKKLKGVWHLVRTSRGADQKESWFLVKSEDKEARKGDEANIVETKPLSVKSKKDLDAIAKGNSVWSSRGKDVEGGVRADMPEELFPQLPTLVDEVPKGERWLHEVKWDGYRVLIFRKGKRLRILTRNGNDWTSKFKELMPAIEGLTCQSAILDGEVVVLDDKGRSHFHDLQRVLAGELKKPMSLVLFDVVYLNGFDLRKTPLLERKKLLSELLGKKKNSKLVYSEHFIGDASDFYEAACTHHLEGVVSKLASACYAEGRSKDWLKVKCILSEELVVVGYTVSNAKARGIAALLLGKQEGAKLVYAGKVGTGFSEKETHTLLKTLAQIKARRSAVVNPPSMKNVVWVHPKYLAQVNFTEWTADGSLRHPSFQGIREDKSVAEVAPAAIAITNPDKVLFPDPGYTKRELVEYYEAVGEVMLPYLLHRPITSIRCPNGYDKQCFFQKHLPAPLPEGLHEIDVVLKSRGDEIYFGVESEVGILSLAQLAVLEIHNWGSSLPDLMHPDMLVFDFDPDEGVTWKRTTQAVIMFRDYLEEFGLKSFVKTTGGKGFHIVLPIEREFDWDQIKALTKAMVDDFANRHPAQFTSALSKKDRKGRIFIDYLRNAYTNTAISPYSSRRKPGATVAMPIEWDEVTAKLNLQKYTIKTVPDLIAKRKRDPWHDYFSTRNTLHIFKDLLNKLGLMGRSA